MTKLNEIWKEAAPKQVFSTWLGALNSYRAMADLRPVSESERLSRDDRKHADYLVMNHGRLTMGAGMHDEAPAAPGFSPEGRIAASQSNVNQAMFIGDPPADWAINGWIEAPFHRGPLLNPNLSTVGYGESCQSQFCAAALNVQAGSQRARHDFVTPRPILFPPDKSSVPLAVSSIRNEWPSPITSCPGYKFPTGPAITIQLGGDFDARLGDFSVLSEGQQLAACAFDS
ncbi:MAG TPA: CAP domain-containing protein, partial [Candidatus Binataceae bacterium]|nr:CAP domain-containing protein [Candidatus Binataceae bacterium]